MIIPPTKETKNWYEVQSIRLLDTWGNFTKEFARSLCKSEGIFLMEILKSLKILLIIVTSMFEVASIYFDLIW